MIPKVMRKKSIGLIKKPLTNSKRSYQTSQKNKVNSVWSLPVWRFWGQCILARRNVVSSRLFQASTQPGDCGKSLNSGTTWLKALTFAIMTRSHVNEFTNPLLTRMAHDCVPFIELELYSSPKKLNLEVPLVPTHIP